MQCDIVARICEKALFTMEYMIIRITQGRRQETRGAPKIPLGPADPKEFSRPSAIDRRLAEVFGGCRH